MQLKRSALQAFAARMGANCRRCVKSSAVLLAQSSQPSTGLAECAALLPFGRYHRSAVIAAIPP